MKISNLHLKIAIEKGAEIIAPLWPMQTMIARNPLQGLERLHFEEAFRIGQIFLGADWDNPESVNQVNGEMIKWCQVFLDEGQAPISMPEREKGFYEAWASLSRFDPRWKSLKKKKKEALFPSDPEEAILSSLETLGVEQNEMEEYFKYSLGQLPGWAGYIQWLIHSEKRKHPIDLIDFLAVRLILTCAIDKNSKENFLKRKKESSDLSRLNVSLFEKIKNRESSYFSHLLSSILSDMRNRNEEGVASSRPAAQIVFCIDVRSEPFRRRIEREGDYETFGFAGFFGLPISIWNDRREEKEDCCPVLVKPVHLIFEEPVPEEKKKMAHFRRGKIFFAACKRVYGDLKYNFGTPFALVETLGIWFGLWMGFRTLFPRGSVRLRKWIGETIKPSLRRVPKMDIPLPLQTAYAESALRTMGLTKNFSRLVLFCGHGSQTENNPYASSLDCGACGGKHGGANGNVLAAILNSQEVRRSLFEKGISIPHDTLFGGAEHNTTTDEVILEEQLLSETSHREDLEQLKSALRQAGIENREARGKTLGLFLSDRDGGEDLLRRGSDWSETRPEWGLARNAAFIVGRRAMTKNLDLKGRCFLHSYNWQEDEEGICLEKILTAPMVVAQWINAQYFFSSLNPIAYGSGSKITQNVVCKIGVMQGNSSDLMQGLPLQSVNRSDDTSYHEPIRLQVAVCAPRLRIEKIVEKHPILQNLILNEWIVFAAIDPIDLKGYRLSGKSRWEEILLRPDSDR